MNPKSPNPIDIYVGSRVRLRRNMAGMSQQRLGEMLGVTFQQVQKYEKGTNRIGASRLQRISEILDAPVSFFFQDGDTAGASRGMSKETESENELTQFAASREGVALNRAFAAIKNPRIRQQLLALAKSVAQGSTNVIDDAEEGSDVPRIDL